MRGIREEPRAAKALDEALAKWVRASDAWEAATWAVVRDPTIGEPVTESGRVRAFTVEGARSIGLPTLTILYEIEPALIVIHSARFEEAKYAQSGTA